MDTFVHTIFIIDLYHERFLNFNCDVGNTIPLSVLLTVSLHPFAIGMPIADDSEWFHKYFELT